MIVLAATVVVVAVYMMALWAVFTEDIPEVVVNCPKCGRCMPCGRCTCAPSESDPR